MSKILVIEDNADILEEVMTWLELEGYEATGASNGNLGVQLAFKMQPNLILCDIMMPEKDGHRVLMELRANKATSLTPFIFITAKQEKSDIRYGMELGADDYITKPFTRAEFLSAIRSRLERVELFAEDSQQKLQNLRDNLFRSLPHELRTPLVAILGVGSILSQDAYSITPAEILEYSSMIMSSGQQLFRLIENHLLYVQLEMKARSPESAATYKNSKAIDPQRTIEETSNFVARNYNRINDLSLELGAGRIHINSDHLAKIITEITDNAFKFSYNSTLVKVHAWSEAQSYIIEVHDHGHGIKAADIARIGAYVQFERDRYEQQGSGLGLTIVRLLTDLYGGSMKVTSVAGLGTVVQVKLPNEP